MQAWTLREILSRIGIVAFVVLIVILPIWASRPWEEDSTFWLKVGYALCGALTAGFIIGGIIALKRQKRARKRQSYYSLFTDQGQRKLG